MLICLCCVCDCVCGAWWCSIMPSTTTTTTRGNGGQSLCAHQNLTPHLQPLLPLLLLLTHCQCPAPPLPTLPCQPSTHTIIHPSRSTHTSASQLNYRAPPINNQHPQPLPAPFPSCGACKYTEETTNSDKTQVAKVDFEDVTAKHMHKTWVDRFPPSQLRAAAARR